MFIVLLKDIGDLDACFTRVTSRLGSVKFLEYEFKGRDSKSGKVVLIKSMKGAYFVTVYDEKFLSKFKFPEKDFWV